MCCECTSVAGRVKRRPASKKAPKAKVAAKRKSAPKVKTAPKRKAAPKVKTAPKRKAAPKRKSTRKAKAAPKRTAEDKPDTDALAVVESSAAVEPQPAPNSLAGRQIRLIDRVGIRDAASLKSQLIATAAADAPIVIDADDAEAVDTAVLQLLVAFCNRARANNKTVSWKDASGVLMESAHVLGLQQYLAFESEPPE